MMGYNTAESACSRSCKEHETAVSAHPATAVPTRQQLYEGAYLCSGKDDANDEVQSEEGALVAGADAPEDGVDQGESSQHDETAATQQDRPTK